MALVCEMFHNSKQLLEGTLLDKYFFSLLWPWLVCFWKGIDVLMIPTIPFVYEILFVIWINFSINYCQISFQEFKSSNEHNWIIYQFLKHIMLWLAGLWHIFSKLGWWWSAVGGGEIYISNQPVEFKQQNQNNWISGMSQVYTLSLPTDTYCCKTLFVISTVMYAFFCPSVTLLNAVFVSSVLSLNLFLFQVLHHYMHFLSQVLHHYIHFFVSRHFIIIYIFVSSVISLYAYMFNIFTYILNYTQVCNLNY